MKPRSIKRGRQIAFYFLVVLLCAMVFNMVSGAMELYNSQTALHEWYWAIIAIGAIYAGPILLAFIVYMVFRSKSKRIRRRREN